MSRAEELFHRITSGGTAEIERMISSVTVEELFLDYKRSSTNLPSNRIGDDDRRNLARAISGFGNSEGGIIVWGVDCRRTENGDVPVDPPCPITHAVMLKTLFDGAIGGLTLPAHSGVESVPLLYEQQQSGFVITLVPPGFNVPYRTLVGGEQYYIRAGSSFLPTPHGVLAGLFGRALQPNVVPRVRERTIERVLGAAIARVTFDVSIKNVGRGMAEDVFAIVNMQLPQNVIATFQRGGHFGWRQTAEGSDVFTILLQDFRLPPEAERDAFTMMVDVSSREIAQNTVVTFSSGAAGGGTAKTVVFPGNIMSGICEHYTHNWDSAAAREPGDRLWQWRIRQLLTS